MVVVVRDVVGRLSTSEEYGMQLVVNLSLKKEKEKKEGGKNPRIFLPDLLESLSIYRLLSNFIPKEFVDYGPYDKLKQKSQPKVSGPVQRKVCWMKV